MHIQDWFLCTIVNGFLARTITNLSPSTNICQGRCIIANHGTRLSICLSPISSPWGVCSPCGHPLHDDCRRDLLNSGGRRCPLCKCRVESFVKVYLDVDDADRDEKISELQEEVCCKDMLLTQLYKSKLEMKVEVCNLKRTVFEKEAELEKISSKLCVSNEKNCQLEEEVGRQLKNLEVKNKVIGKLRNNIQQRQREAQLQQQVRQSQQQARQSEELVRQHNAKLKKERRLSQHQMRELQSEKQRYEAEKIAQFRCGICSSIVPSFNFWASGCCSKLFCGECLINCGTIIVCQYVGCQKPIRTHPGSSSPVGWTQNHPFTKKLIEDCAPSCYGCKKNIPKSEFDAHRLACPALNKGLDSLFANEKSAVDSDNIVDESISDEGANLDEQLPASEAILVEAVVSGAYNASISLENLFTTVSHTTGSNNSSGARKEEKEKTPDSLIHSVSSDKVNHMEL
mmetsp:Transcript_29176/g.58645  ORF Transcript_29176/g.58645 Transcript_29176/m.58645 type:complete len:456 (-) Transcript_29176:2841-4208(-)